MTLVDAALWRAWLVYVAVWLVVITGRHMDRDAPPLAQRIGGELTPLWPVFIIGVYLIETMQHGFSVWRVVEDGWSLVAWWSSRNDFDDRWKKRGTRLAERVRAAGHRLEVVPVGGES